MKQADFTEAWHSEAAFLRFGLKILRSKHVETLRDLVSDARSLQFKTRMLFEDILSDCSSLGSNRHDCTTPLYEQDWMPGNLRGLDVYGLLREAGEAGFPSSGAGFEYTTITKLQVAPSTITVLSCDSKYFHLYFKEAITSFGASRIESDAIAFHVCNPDAEVLEAVARTKEPWVTFTTEYRDNAPPAYHACSRYLLAKELLLEYGVPVVISDADVRFHSSPSIVKSLRQPAPSPVQDRIDLCVDQAPALPWQLFLAGFVYIRPGDVGVRFLDLFAGACEFVFSKRLGSYWYIDQNILHYIFSRHLNHAKAWGARDLILKASHRFEKEKIVVRGNR